MIRQEEARRVYMHTHRFALWNVSQKWGALRDRGYVVIMGHPALKKRSS